MDHFKKFNYKKFNFEMGANLLKMSKGIFFHHFVMHYRKILLCSAEAASILLMVENVSKLNYSNTELELCHYEEHEHGKHDIMTGHVMTVIAVR